MAGNDNSGNLPEVGTLLCANTSADGNQLHSHRDRVGRTTGDGASCRADPHRPYRRTLLPVGRLRSGKTNQGKIPTSVDSQFLTILFTSARAVAATESHHISSRKRQAIAHRYAAALLTAVSISILPGFSHSQVRARFHLGAVFKPNATTLYVCDEGDGVLVTPSAVATAILAGRFHSVW